MSAAEPKIIKKPGIFNIGDDEYHADPCPEPSISSSLAKILLEQSPLHAWTAHPRLNPNFETEEKAAFDLGSAAHAVMLGSDAVLDVIDAEDWRGKEARAARESARAAGLIPVLKDQHKRIMAMVEAARAQLRHHREARDAFEDGSPERTLIWRDGAVWCRSKLDWLPDGGRVFYDYKTCGGSASPAVWGERAMFANGYDIQAAFYSRGIRALMDVPDPIFRFVVQETTPPYALTVCQLKPFAVEMADRRVEEAIETWGYCLARNEWPSYPAFVCHVEPPVWHEKKVMDREASHQAMAEEGTDWKETLLHWQAPQNWRKKNGI